MSKYIAAIILALSFAAQGQTTSSAPKEQLAFLSLDTFPASAPLPQHVLKILLRQRMVRESMEGTSDEDKKNPAQLFRAAEVHLSSTKEVDLFIVGNAPIAGADNGWFWIIRSAHKNPKIVLFTTGYTVESLSHKTNGYHDIQSTWSSPNGTETRIYKFNGTKYRLTKDRWDERR